ncbi:MAG TPA: hypothetical protein VFH06_04795 [Candidatus Saccharimonadales bacterium]|nr:hypothetical protein [Candidatus Saccharimonadales bacterium]
MLDTQSRPSPATFAKLLAAKKAQPAAPATSTTRPAPSRRRKPYTTQSAGYEVPRSLPAKATPVDQLVPRDIDPLDSDIIELEGDDTEREPEGDRADVWMPGLGAFDIDQRPRLKRPTIIDELDPTEELDLTPEFWGFSIVTW